MSNSNSCLLESHFCFALAVDVVWPDLRDLASMYHML